MSARAKSSVRKARIAALESRDKLNRLAKRPGVIAGDPGKLVRAPTFDEAAWRKKWGKFCSNKDSGS